jgi:hypothetical protein
MAAAAVVSSPPTSSSETDFVIEWYGENKPSEIDLLEEYFSQNPRLAKQVLDMKATREKDKLMPNWFVATSSTLKFMITF